MKKKSTAKHGKDFVCVQLMERQYDYPMNPILLIILVFKKENRIKHPVQWGWYPYFVMS